MEYRLTKKTHSYIQITKNKSCFYLLPCSFEYEKSYPTKAYQYKRVIKMRFTWLRWSFEILGRKPRKE